MPDFGHFWSLFLLFSRKCLIFSEKKVAFFLKKNLKNVAQFKKMLYLYNVKEKQILTIKTLTTMTNQEIYMNGVILFKRIATATMNVKNGSRWAEDMKLAFEEVNRLPKMFAWMKENGMWQNFNSAVNGFSRNVDMNITMRQIIEKYSK